MPTEPIHPIAAVALVTFGGGIGSATRYLITMWASPWSDRFPTGTLLVNVFGCLLAGVLLWITLEREIAPALRLFVATGILGGLTTFSTFGFETVMLFHRGLTLAGMLNVIVTVVLSLGATAAGFAAARVFA